METLTVIYLTYIFLAIYFLTMFLLIYFKNWRRMYEVPPITRQYTLSVVVPCYNAEKEIGETIQTLLDSDYKGLKKIIVVDDRSTDNSYRIAKSYQRKYPKRVLVVRTPKNTGRAAGAKNYGAKFVKTQLIGFTDDDSRPRKDAVSSMIGFFNDPEVGGVTSRVLVQNRNRFIEKFQAVEYKIIAFTRKLFNFIESVYVTNGPLSIYRKKVFDMCDGFSMTNWTEDIELTWHALSKGYKIRMAMAAKVYTIAPKKFKEWFRQRLRWNVGGIQTMSAYKKVFFKHGMLGIFILPFFLLAWCLAIFGFLVLVYRVVKILIIRYMTANLSIEAQTAILTLREFNLTPTVLVFFGISILAMSIFYNILALAYSKEQDFKKHNLLTLIGYMFFYLTMYPAILIISIYNYAIGKQKW